jgi:hypothetical protein
MAANFDMNSYRIINTAAAVSETDVPNLGQIQSLLNSHTVREVVTITTNANLNTADTGKAITNFGATANITYTLPPAVVGRLYEIRNATDLYTLTVAPNGTDRISTGAAGGVAVIETRGMLVLECQSSGRWDVMASAGLWSVTP